MSGYIPKTLNIKIYILENEIENTDYIKLYCDQKTGTIITTEPLEILKNKGIEELSGGNYYLFESYVQINEPGTYKFNFTVCDEIGNESGLIEEFSKEVLLEYEPPDSLPVPEYDPSIPGLIFSF